MSHWQERITRDTAPSIRVEHELRYRLAASLVRAADVWADLGCGNGIAAAAAFGAGRPRHAVLVDMAPDVVARAAAELALADVTALCGDLTDSALLGQVEDAILAWPGSRIVTCFEVVEHLKSFAPLLGWAARLARDHEVTVFLSVPNDAFWSVQNPHHMTTWGEGSFEELKRLLPADHTLLRQVALAGSAIVGEQAPAESHRIEVGTVGAGSVASHFLAVFGPRHKEVRSMALAGQVDTLAARRWERERESNLALAEEALRVQGQTIESQAQTIRSHAAEFEAWRTYIHKLERELGHPLSGADDAQP